MTAGLFLLASLLSAPADPGPPVVPDIGSPDAQTSSLQIVATGGNPQSGSRDAVIASRQAFSIGTSYTADIWTNASGGIRTGTRYLDDLTLSAKANLGKLIGLPNTRVYASLLYNNGTHFSQSLVGDAQFVSNIETNAEALRVYEAWIETGYPDRLSVRAGLYDLNSEFDVLTSAQLFIHSAHGIGTDIGQSGRNGPSIFPVTGLATRLQVRLSSRWMLRVAMLDGVPGDPDHPAETTIQLNGRNGALIVAEAERELGNGSGKLLIGGWRYTARFAPLDARGRPGHDDQGAYVRGETILYDGWMLHLSGFARLGIAAGRYNDFGAFVSGGLALNGVLGGTAGVAFASAITSKSAHHIPDAPLRGTETSVEITYQRPVNDWLTVQPDVQYVVNPGAVPGRRDAVVLGLRLGLQFSN